MSTESPEQDEQLGELPAIEFASPGRFSIHNPASLTEAPTSTDPAPFQLGHDSPLQRASQPAELRAHALALAQQAQRTLCIFTPDLEPWLYDSAAMREACCRLLLARPQNQVRILLRDSGRAVREGHRLLTLARRLPSNMQIRKLRPDQPAEEVAFLLADDRGLLLRPELEQYAGYALYNDPARTHQRQAQFDQAWAYSALDPDLRSFLL